MLLRTFTFFDNADVFVGLRNFILKSSPYLHCYFRFKMFTKSRDYPIGRELGRGTFGRVFEVTNGNETFAMKVVSNIDEYAIQEPVILENTNHPNVIKYVDYFLEGRSLNIVMEYADQGALSKQKINWSEQEIWKFLAQMGSAFSYLYREGIIYRNLNPDNILCVSGNKSETVFKISDFGIARLVDDATRNNNYRNTCGVKCFYMAPEVLKEEECTFSADMWSLGAVASFVCNKGKHLFRSIYEVTQSEGVIDPLPDHFSLELRHIVVELLRVNAKERPIAFDIYKKADKVLLEMTLENNHQKKLLLILGAAFFFFVIIKTKTVMQD